MAQRAQSSRPGPGSIPTSPSSPQKAKSNRTGHWAVLSLNEFMSLSLLQAEEDRASQRPAQSAYTSWKTATR